MFEECTEVDKILKKYYYNTMSCESLGLGGVGLGSGLSTHPSISRDVLVDNWSPEQGVPLRGLAGIESAHTTLVEHEEAGVLIGGVALALWDDCDNLIDRLQRHKDVDVITFGQQQPYVRGVASPEESTIAYTEGGIDWWGRIGQNRNSSRQLKNLNNVALRYMVRARKTQPGLYIPSLSALREMTTIENALLRPQDQEVDTPRVTLPVLHSLWTLAVGDQDC